MPYTVTASERNNHSASTQETKALLYLTSFRQDSDDIFYYVIDFFNDVTGVDRAGSRAWDIQSKASHNLSQSATGQYLVTLYKNYLSEFNFTSYILFVGGFSSSILNDTSLLEFDINNFTNSAQIKIFKALKQEALSRTYINHELVNDESLKDFLSKVTFVIANEEKAAYIRKIIKVNPDILPNDAYLNHIFDEIRKNQMDKKNIRTEGVTITVLDEFENYKKYMTNSEVKMMVLSRLIHKNGIKNLIPLSFLSILEGYDELEKREIITDCQNAMYRVMFDINNCAAYWDLFADIYKNIRSYPAYDINDIYRLLEINKINRVQFLDIKSTKFFIALVKEGLQDV